MEVDVEHQVVRSRVSKRGILEFRNDTFRNGVFSLPVLTEDQEVTGVSCNLPKARKAYEEECPMRCEEGEPPVYSPGRHLRLFRDLGKVFSGIIPHRPDDPPVRF